MKPIKIHEKKKIINYKLNTRVIAEPNQQQIRLVKILGDFPFHIHDDEDELFFVVKGNLRMDFEGHSEFLKENEFIVVPAGVSHRPFAEKEVHLMMFVTNKNINTGNLNNERTLNTDNLERI
jgi:mannose-6-phosphate isomerase-like protein (cupin superfamily)